MTWSGSGSGIQRGASKQPMISWPEWIHRCLWCTMIWVILDHWSCSWSKAPQRNTPKICCFRNTLQDSAHLTPHFQSSIQTEPARAFDVAIVMARAKRITKFSIVPCWFPSWRQHCVNLTKTVGLQCQNILRKFQTPMERNSLSLPNICCHFLVRILHLILCSCCNRRVSVRDQPKGSFWKEIGVELVIILIKKTSQLYQFYQSHPAS